MVSSAVSISPTISVIYAWNNSPTAVYEADRDQNERHL